MANSQLNVSKVEATFLLATIIELAKSDSDLDKEVSKAIKGRELDIAIKMMEIMGKLFEDGVEKESETAQELVRKLTNIVLY